MLPLAWFVFARGSAFQDGVGSFSEHLLFEPALRVGEFEHPGDYEASGLQAGQWTPLELGFGGERLWGSAFFAHSKSDSSKDKLVGLKFSAERGLWGLDATASEFSYSQLVAGRWLKWASDTRLLLVGIRRELGGAWFGLASGALVPVEGSVLLPLRAYARGSWWAASLTGLALTSDRRSLLSLSGDTGSFWARVDLSFGGDTLWSAARAGVRGPLGEMSFAAVKGDSLRFSALVAPRLKLGSQKWVALEPRLWVGSWGARWAVGASAGLSWICGGLIYDPEEGFGAKWEVLKCF